VHQALANEITTRFPVISFRKKRLTVAIPAHFDMESASDAASVKQMIEAAITRHLRDAGHGLGDALGPHAGWCPRASPSDPLGNIQRWQAPAPSSAHYERPVLAMKRRAGRPPGTEAVVR
jgi:hypothetical protein